MARKPSERRHASETPTNLNLTPMMNLIAILIPALLVSVAFVQIVALEVALPADRPTLEDKEIEPPPTVTLAITERGYRISGVSEHDAEIPIVRREVECNRFIGTRPPPRARNTGEPACTEEEKERTFWVYDNDALKTELVAIKEEHHLARQMIIVAEPDVQYEAVTDVIDTSREYEWEDGLRPLFDEVLVRPTL